MRKGRKSREPRHSVVSRRCAGPGVDAERRRDIRRKIQLGGLIIKAGRADEEVGEVFGTGEKSFEKYDG